MNFPSELRKAKQVIREWIRTHFSDEKLASVAALNEDGKMGFRTPCGCLLGVTYSDPLHVGHDCNHEHYRRARRQDLALLSPSGMGPAEKAYLFLGFTAVFRNCFGDDEVRRRRFSALLRAEMHRRKKREWGERDIEFSSLPGHPSGEEEPQASLVTDP
jgi:hypothetical protein